MTEETIFTQALEKQTPEERTAFLDETCGQDATLRQRVEALLRSHTEAAGFLEKPALVQLQQTEATTAPEESQATIGVSKPDVDATEAEDTQVGEEHLSFLKPSEKSESLGRLDHYEILELIGKGGFGMVLKAFDERLRRVVAVKVLSPAFAANGSARKRFTREAQAVAAIKNEHVVGIYDVNKDANPPYLVMECIEGTSLQQKINKQGPLGLKEILRIGMQIAEGLAAAHKQGKVHRDIKPANILLENGVERVKITDFGLARAVDDASVTQSGTVAGTPMYMSPEQAEGLIVDHRSDLFSLGTVLYAMCTGHPPFRASGSHAVLKRVIDASPRPIREINNEVPDWLCDIIAKLHAKKPEDRYQTAKEVAESLGQRLADVQAGRAIERASRGSGASEAVVTLSADAGSSPINGARKRRTAVNALTIVGLLGLFCLFSFRHEWGGGRVAGSKEAITWKNAESTIWLGSPDTWLIWGRIGATETGLRIYWFRWSVLFGVLGGISLSYAFRVWRAGRRLEAAKAPVANAPGSPFRDGINAALPWLGGGVAVALFMLASAVANRLNKGGNEATVILGGPFHLAGLDTVVVKSVDIVDNKIHNTGKHEAVLKQEAGFVKQRQKSQASLPPGKYLIEAVCQPGYTVGTWEIASERGGRNFVGNVPAIFDLEAGERLVIQLALKQVPTAAPPGVKPAPNVEVKELSPSTALHAIAPFDEKKAKEHQEAWAKHLGVEPEIKNSIGMKLRLIPAGTFTMGTPQTEIDDLVDKTENWNKHNVQSEGPQRQVSINEPFCLGIHEVTVAQFRMFVKDKSYQTWAERTGKGGRGYDGDTRTMVLRPGFIWTSSSVASTENHPVVLLHREDVEAFCAWLSKKEGKTYRLPSEEEWEFACRAGSQTRWFWGDDAAQAKLYAWFQEPATSARQMPVGLRLPNPFGLYDMAGNVAEKTLDQKGMIVMRGGHAGYRIIQLRSGAREIENHNDPTYRNGFRVAVAVK